MMLRARLDHAPNDSSCYAEDVERGYRSESEEKPFLHVAIHRLFLLVFRGLRLKPFVANHARCCRNVLPCLYLPRGITAAA